MKKFLLFIPVFGLLVICLSCQSEGGAAKMNRVERARMDSIFALLPESRGLVNDFENVLSTEEEKKLYTKIDYLNSNTPYQIVVVTTESIAPFEDIMTYATALGNKWEVGDAEDNNGLVVIVSSKLGKTAIVSGNGIEETFPPEVTKRIIDKAMIPHFIRSEFYAGFARALEQIDKLNGSPASDSQN